MKKGDVLLKKWCFGISYRKLYERVEMEGNEAKTTYSFPKYRSIALRVLSVKKKGKKGYEVEGEQYASLTAKPKKVKIFLKELPNGTFGVEGQKRAYHKLSIPTVLDDKMPPVGSLVTLNKRHALVVSVGRNEMTVFLDGIYSTVSVKPGAIKWWSDKIIASLPQTQAAA
jgi:hypothetical protein|tara:strand:- start:3738 stop:4247 length:510 start_codon:yes stop_codon:yes gene_type:complete